MDSNTRHSELNSIAFNTSAQLYSGLDSWDTLIQFLSLRSVCLTSPKEQPIAPGDIFRLNIPIEGARGIGMSIQVTKVNQNTFEAKWTQIDMDSFIHHSYG